MKSAVKVALAFSLACSALSLPAQTTVVSENFTSPTTLLQTSGTAARILGGSGTYALGTWVYSSGGSITGGVANVRTAVASNARAISVIFAPSLFTAGTEYTVSFDVIGQTSASDTGRFWLAALSGYNGSNSILTNTAPSGTWTTAVSPYTANLGSPQINYLGGMASTGTLLTGENVTGTTTTTLNFTYTAGTAIAFAVGTYDNVFSIDNFSISTVAVPEPSTYALFAGVAALSVALYRRRRQTATP
jgi:hypothetical protein